VAAMLTAAGLGITFYATGFETGGIQSRCAGWSAALGLLWPADMVMPLQGGAPGCRHFSWRCSGGASEMLLRALCQAHQCNVD
jgi:hypothetical protein